MIKCVIVKDILPLYTDDVLSVESKKLIGEHLATCEECKKEFINMQSEVKIIQDCDDKKIEVLKSIKKKIFYQNIFIAILSGMFGLTWLIIVGSLFSQIENELIVMFFTILGVVFCLVGITVKKLCTYITGMMHAYDVELERRAKKEEG